MSAFKPYANETDALALDELTIENRLDQVALYGSVVFTKDKAGLERATKVKTLIDAIVEALHREPDLPEHIAVKPTDKVKNPF